MDELLFGTGGVPHSAGNQSTVAGIQRLAELGLGCMELEFVQGVRMGVTTAREVAAVARRLGIRLTAHAPYFINLNSHEPDKIAASQIRLLQTARIGAICGVESIVFHAAFYMDDPPETAYVRVKNYLAEVLRQLKQENNSVVIRPELMGRTSQFGSIEEIVRLCTDLEGVAPAIDISHWHARCGACNSYDEFNSLLQSLHDRLGRGILEKMHFHISGIKYGRRGEIKHLALQDPASDFNYADFLRALKDNDVRGFAICESPRDTLEEDALLLQETYRSLAVRTTRKS